ncbi:MULTISPECIES: preprotein translocase subunit SecG [Malaciobacter]|jgi:preprotein translocase subunit SecG|uniref:Protein-export membrane protein SecG n=2 Tax=Malaciobacter TaxID=2321114 RepID=A0A1T5EB85_9BACT|nr:MULTISPECIES: preprotein translocase subunit SecG [Malaciobacter]AXX88461.1 preprotein translocase SecYEG, SecG subunit [Malaciobacter marinus]PHO09302.1 preprotein translocase subunit SecG [Malaciobacter canalis]PHO12112.1 preprotein translocase subunit SecG [Malaciobacter marinus]PHO16614.1 preprotein translocase subunit SecG [Malaciobacter marinus]PPK62603.1 preprotein translocase subunit SecG [Malaciobacter marinus]
MTSTLLIVQFVLAIILTITILLQKSSSIGLGAYSGSNDSLFGAKGPGSFLSKATMAIGLIFVINTLVLGYMYNEQRNKSAIDNVKINTLIPNKPEQKNEQSAPAAPTAPSVPATK